MSAETALVTALGIGVVGLALRDVFHTLFHPGGHGGLVSLACRAAAWACGRLGPRTRHLAGPTGVVVTVAAWLGLLVVGLALILLALVPQDLTYGPGSPRGAPYVDAVYLSAVSLSTLGLGDVVVQEPSLRWLVALAALLGFSVLTAAITWITQIYFALSRRRSLSLDVWTTLGDGLVEERDRPLESWVVRSWASRLAEVDVDLIQNTETFWFRESDSRLALAPALQRLDEVVALRPDSPEGRHLRRALDVVRGTLRDQYGDDAASAYLAQSGR